MRRAMDTPYAGDMTEEQIRREMSRLLVSRNTHKLSGAMVSIAHDFINYRYSMSHSMSVALLNKLRNLPIYEEMELYE